MRLRTLKQCLGIPTQKRRKSVTKKDIVKEYDRIYEKNINSNMSEFLATEATMKDLNRRYGKSRVQTALSS